MGNLFSLIDAEKTNNDNLRLTENNTYFSQVYEAKMKIVRIIALLCLPIILIGILKQRYLLTSNVAGILVAIIIFIGLLFIVPAITDMYKRDSMNYDEYKFPFDPSAKSNPVIDTTIASAPAPAPGPGPGSQPADVPECVGKECCTNLGLEYNATTKKCIVKPSMSLGTEGFLSGQSTQDSGSLFDSKTADKSLIAIDMSGKYYSL